MLPALLLLSGPPPPSTPHSTFFILSIPSAPPALGLGPQVCLSPRGQVSGVQGPSDHAPSGLPSLPRTAHLVRPTRLRETMACLLAESHQERATLMWPPLLYHLHLRVNLGERSHGGNVLRSRRSPIPLTHLKSGPCVPRPRRPLGSELRLSPQPSPQPCTHTFPPASPGMFFPVLLLCRSHI